MLKTLLFVLWYRKHACPMYGHRQRHDGEDEQWYTECRNQRAYVKKLNLGGINLLTSNGIYYDYTTTDGRRLNFTKAQLVRKSDDLWRCSSLTTPPISAAARASSCAVVSVTSTSMSSSKAYRHRATFT